MLPARAARALPSTVELTVNLFKDSVTSDMMGMDIFDEKRGSCSDACKDLTDSGTVELNVVGTLVGGVSDINSDWEVGSGFGGERGRVSSTFKLFGSEISAGGLVVDFTVGLLAMRSMARLMGVERQAASLHTLHHPRDFGGQPGPFLEQASYLKPLWKVLLRNCLSASHMYTP